MNLGYAIEPCGVRSRSRLREMGLFLAFVVVPSCKSMAAVAGVADGVADGVKWLREGVKSGTRRNYTRTR